MHKHNPHRINQITTMMKVSEIEAIQIADVVAQEWLLDWSEATLREYRRAFKDAQYYIRNGFSWEEKA